MKTIDICTHCIHYMQTGGVACTWTLVCGVRSISKYILIIHLKTKCMRILKSPIIALSINCCDFIIHAEDTSHQPNASLEVHVHILVFFLDQIESCLESNDFLCFYDNNQKLNNFENILIVAYSRHAIEDVI